jgi:hypothetical protein
MMQLDACKSCKKGPEGHGLCDICDLLVAGNSWKLPGCVDPASFRGGGIQPFPDNYAFKRHATEDRAQSGCLDGWEIC